MNRRVTFRPLGKQIRTFPESSPLVNRTVRRKLIDRFPYSLLYSITGGDIRILAVASARPRPYYWRGRR